jgi:hypothetical protein
MSSAVPIAGVSKSEFARLAGVSNGRVTQWLKAGRISGAALVGHGRGQRLVVPVALSQLRARLDPSQRAINGGHTKLDRVNGKAAPTDDDAALKSAVLAERQARAELVQIQRDRQSGSLIRRIDVQRAAEVAAETIVTVLENAACHGATGKGDGWYAARILKNVFKMSDLSELAKNNNGVFEGAFGKQPRPFVGWMILVEDPPESRRPVTDRSPHFPVFKEFKGASYLHRYKILCQRLIQEQLYSSASGPLIPMAGCACSERAGWPRSRLSHCYPTPKYADVYLTDIRFCEGRKKKSL